MAVQPVTLHLFDRFLARTEGALWDMLTQVPLKRKTATRGLTQGGMSPKATLGPGTKQSLPGASFGGRRDSGERAATLVLVDDQCKEGLFPNKEEDTCSGGWGLY